MKSSWGLNWSNRQEILLQRTLWRDRVRGRKKGWDGLRLILILFIFLVVFFGLLDGQHWGSSCKVEEPSHEYSLEPQELGQSHKEGGSHVPQIRHGFSNAQSGRSDCCREGFWGNESEQCKPNSIEESTDAQEDDICELVISNFNEQSEYSWEKHEDNDPELPLHLMAEKVGEETAEKFQTAYD